MTALPDRTAEPVLNPKLPLSAAPGIAQDQDGSLAVCGRCGERREYFVHEPSTQCRGGYPCINPGAHHAFVDIDERVRELTEAESRALWGDR